MPVSTDFIPVNQPEIGERELEYVTEALRSGWISSEGPFVGRFEEDWAAYCGRRFGVALANGTAALDVAVRALELGPGDEVIVPTFTIVSCVQAIVGAGATAVLVDSEPRTWCLDVEQVAARITPRTRAVMPVHIYGHPVDMDPLLALADEHGLTVLEDAAEAHGAEYRSRRCGSFGAASVFSFYANKLVTTGEGGMLLTDDPAVAERARSLRNLCFGPGRRFRHEQLGFNYRLTNLQAALGVAQIERMDDIVERKRRIGLAYREQLTGIPGIELQVEEDWARSVFWMVGIVVTEETGLDAPALAARLREHGVDTRPFFLGMHEQPVFHELGLFAGESHPVAERLGRQGLYLPSGVALTDEQLARACAAVRAVVA